jgi:hypothetical protein
MQNTTDNSETSKFSGQSRKILLAVAVVIIAIYIIGAVFFHNRYLYGTKIGDEKIGGKTKAQVEAMLSEEAKNYKLTLNGRQDFEDEISGEEIDLTISYGESLSNGLEKQNSFLWFLGASGDTKNLTADVSYDDKKLAKAIKNLTCFDKKNIIKPVNAKIVANDNNEFEIQEEVYGTTVKKDKLTESITNALATIGDSINLEDEQCYKDPTLLKDDPKLASGIEQANKLASVTITYDFQYTTEVVDKSLIKDWIKFDDDMNASLSYKKVLSYIEDLAKKYDTYSTIRTIKDASGKKHKVYYGSYGWKISQTKEAKKLMKVIKKGKDVTREPIYLYEAVCRKEGNIDWDDTYVCVNITNQSMVYIKDGEAVLSSDVVTGDPTKGRSTPTGAYAVMYKTRNATLSGQGYSSPVSYWMPFTTNVGFHDASWQPYFGGSRYKGNGSHGCVNMPTGSAAALYKILEKGTPVFVYK